LFSAEEKLLLYSYSQYKDSEFINNIYIVNYITYLLLHLAFWKQFITHQRMHCYIVIV